jgi:hypothetical protein
MNLNYFSAIKKTFRFRTNKCENISKTTVVFFLFQVLSVAAALLIVGVSAEESKKVASNVEEKNIEKRGLSGHYGGGGSDHGHEQKTKIIYQNVPAPYEVVKEIHVPVEKKTYYPVEKKVIQPYPVIKNVGYPVKEIVKVPYHVPKPYPVEKVEHYAVHKYVEKPYPVKVYINKPYPVYKDVHYPVEKKVKAFFWFNGSIM